MATVRRLLGRHLVGRGVELGPGDKPFPVLLPGVEVAYVDRWEPHENRELFPELGPAAAFPRPDYVCNLDTDRLRMLVDESQDFVIASHVLEHVAEPIGLLDEIHRVLRPGGVVLVLLPDRRRTFDRHREPTRLDHLVAEFRAGVTDVDDEHVREFLENTETPEWFRTHVVEAPAAQRAALFDRHRERSIHVHCWAEEEFLPVLDFAIRELGHRWEFVDGTLTDDCGPEGMEFGYVLRRSTVSLPADVRAGRFAAAFADFAADRRLALQQVIPVVEVVEPSPPRRPLRTVAHRILQRSPAAHRAARTIRAALAGRART